MSNNIELKLFIPLGQRYETRNTKLINCKADVRTE